MRFKVGEVVRWMCPMDVEYSYGTIVEINKTRAIISYIGYYKGRLTEVHIKYLRKLERGGKGIGGGKRNNKLSSAKGKL